MIIVCPHCCRKNKVAQSEQLSIAKCGQCGQWLKPAEPIVLHDENFMQIVPHTEMPILVDFWADWCNPCKAMAPHFAKAAQLYPQVQFAKVDTEASPRLSEFFQIQSIPTLILFRQTTQIARLSGALTAAQIGQWLQQQGMGR